MKCLLSNAKCSVTFENNLPVALNLTDSVSKSKYEIKKNLCDVATMPFSLLLQVFVVFYGYSYTDIENSVSQSSITRTVLYQVS